ncbi:MAG TPA: ParB/RepB/Spo0J family partition protein [Tenericutes bacterium]|nr:ParB/RepB/Spo0J family partition protein [Mycoplasmatota bacterium]
MKGEKKIININLSDILPNRFQPRIKFNESAIEELAESIKEHGVIQPIVVRQIGDKYEIIAGERRYKASSMANMRTIPAIVTDLDDKESAEIALIENVQRQDLTPIEEAISYKKILDMGYLTQESLALKLGKTQPTIANKLRLLNLDDEVQESLLEGKISERHARSLLKLSDPKKQKNLLNRIILERLTVRQTDEEIKKMINDENIMDKDIEILDFDNLDSFNENKNFNIPSSPIIEDNKEEPFNKFNDDSKNHKDNIEIQEISTIIEDENKINPGFMDIDKIEKEAKDIFIEKEAIDLNNLLKKDDKMENYDIKEDIELNEKNNNENNEENIKPNKFFDDINDDNDLLRFDNINSEEYEYKNINDTLSFDSLFSINDNKVNINDNIEKQKQVKDIDDYFSLNNKIYEKSTDNFSIGIEKPNIKEVINVIRDCTDKIKSLGYMIDTEEMDFENTYQVIFKIKKD